MNVDQMREAVKKAYNTPFWNSKVDAMSDGQVTAIYLRLKRERKL